MKSVKHATRRGTPRIRPGTTTDSVDGRNVPGMIGLTLSWRIAGSFTQLGVPSDGSFPRG
jgi:hypothetical protein